MSTQPSSVFPICTQSIQFCTILPSLLSPPHSRSLIPTPRILHTPLPADPRQENPLNDSHQPQRDRNPSPQPIQLPPESKPRAHTHRNRDDIVTKQLHVPSDLLPAQPAQNAIAARGHCVEKLERGAHGQDFGNQLDDGGIVGEELGDVVSQAR